MVLIDIGGGTTDVAIFHDKSIKHTKVFGIAGNQVTNDIRESLGIVSDDAEQIKKEFGDKLCFWGSIDEQKTLPFGSAADVEAEVQLRLETIGKDGGLILAPTHHVQLDTPLENFWAMVNTITGTSYSNLG